MELSEKIREIRNLKKLKQEDLANACNVTRSAISNWEAGRRRPDWDNLVVLARLFGITIEELVGDELIYYENPEPSSATKKGKKLSYVVPIINTIVTIILIIILLIILLPKINDKSNAFEGSNPKDIKSITLQLENNSETRILYFSETTDTESAKNNIRIFELKELVIDENLFIKYQFCVDRIFMFDIVIQLKISEYSLKLSSSKFFKINDGTNKLNFLDEYNLPYICEPGIYDIILIIKNGLYYIGAFLHF